MLDDESISHSTVHDVESNNTTLTDSKASEGQTKFIHGYQRIADMMAGYPAVAIFKQFGNLNALNLLYYQAELALLEDHLRTLSKSDKNSPDIFRQQYFQGYYYLRERKVDPDCPDPGHIDQWDIICKIREVLKEYNEAIIAQHTIRKMERPAKKSLDALRQWMSPKNSREAVVLLGADRDIWWDTPMPDLVASYARAYEDPISTWITENALFWYNQVIGHRYPKRDLSGTCFASGTEYSRQPVIRFVTFFAILLASLMPIVSIVVLNAMHESKTNLRLGVMALFTVIFCAVFGLFTGPKKTELLAASAAFAAVQVVFISGDNCQSSS